MTRSEAQASSNSYTLSKAAPGAADVSLGASLKRLVPLARAEQRSVGIAFVTVIVSSTCSLLAPLIIGHAVDTQVQTRNFQGLLAWSALLLGVFLVGLVATYAQTLVMGGVGRRVLYALRASLFNKLQELPVAFFNQNKAGDLISRINNDTDKLNQFFAQGLVQLAANLFMMTGAAVFLLSLNVRLGAAALVPALGVFVITRLLSPWVKRANLRSLQSLGGMSAEIQESLSNFKVIVAFNRRDYFRRKFDDANQRNFAASIRSGLASNIFMPIYGLAYNLAQAVVLVYGIYLVSTGGVTIGLLIGFLLYVNNFYLPLRQLAAVWAMFQLALAGLDRISAVLALQSNLPVLPPEPARTDSVMAFEDVSFSYPESGEVLTAVTFALQRGKTYALVGPTGGGKTTTASLMARLYDPARGRVLLDGRDIRTYEPAERAGKIGFILQEPFLFTGTIGENLRYGNERYAECSAEALRDVLASKNLSGLLSRFPQGLDTKVSASGEAVSLGEKQIIAFMRAVLREPDVLILDEATANIDTATEQVLEQILDKLPASTTRVVVAHRLNTIANADEIFFVNAGTVMPAGSMEQAVEMLLHGKRAS